MHTLLKPRPLLVLLLMIAVSGAVVWIATGRSGESSQPHIAGATATSIVDETQVFDDLIRREGRVHFDALVSGDPSEFASVYYNDPAVPVEEYYTETLQRVGADAVAAVLEQLHSGPKGGPDGLLSARIASILYMFANVRTWEAVERKAAAEGRQPTAEEVASMPFGELPMKRKNPNDWIVVKHYIWDVVIDGNHATAKRAFIDPELATGDWLAHYGGYYVIYTFTNVDGQWYVSGETQVFWPFTDTVPATDDSQP